MTRFDSNCNWRVRIFVTILSFTANVSCLIILMCHCSFFEAQAQSVEAVIMIIYA